MTVWIKTMVFVNDFRRSSIGFKGCMYIGVLLLSLLFLYENVYIGATEISENPNRNDGFDDDKLMMKSSSNRWHTFC